MSFPPNNQGKYTGLMGYDLTYEYFGETIPYKLVEKYSYEVYDMDLVDVGDDKLKQVFKTSFADLLNIFSGNINITSLSFPNSNDVKENLIQFQKYEIEFEVRKGGSSTDFTSDFDDYAGVGTKNYGIDDVIKSGVDLFNFSNNFTFNLADDGTKDYTHDISFTLRTGELGSDFNGLRASASQIASGLFSKQTGVGPHSFSEYTGYSSTDSKQYNSETFDSLKNSFSFSKRRKILPSGTSSYSFDANYSLNYAENGVYSVEEKLKIYGKLSFQQAVDGYYNDLKNSSSGRCQDFYDSFKNVFYSGNTSAVGGILNGVDISNSKNIILTKESLVNNVPDITLEATLSYTDDPNYLGKFQVTEALSLNRQDNGYLNIDHSFDYVVLTGINSLNLASISDIYGQINSDKNSSLATCNDYYNGMTGYYLNNQAVGNPALKLALTNTKIDAPQRGKNYKLSLSYTNDAALNPEYWKEVLKIDSQYTGKFTKISFNTTKNYPKNNISEYVVVNKQDRKSVLNYSYQQQEATVNHSYDGNLVRSSNMLIEPILGVGNDEAAHALFKASKEKFLNDNSSDFNNHLVDYNNTNLSYQIKSDNTFNSTFDYRYNKKKKTSPTSNINIIGL